jgi:hypothetical protein
MDELRKLLRETQPMTSAQRAAQRESFAYGNVHLENKRVTRQVVSMAARQTRRGRAQGK